MALGRGIVEVFEAIPVRIEVEGHEPTWRVTGGSFESVLEFATEALGETTVVARADRTRWWPRVTLTLTTDPELAATAPPLETFAVPPEPDAAPEPDPTPEPDLEQPDRGVPAQRPAPDSPLESVFAYQEAARRARQGVPEQRRASD